MEARTQWVNTTDQQRLYVKVWGDEQKPALVLVHGYPDNQEVWEPVIKFLAQDFYIVTYDVRGAGQSSVPRRVNDFRLAQLSQDLDSVTQAVLGERPFHLAAHDWGSIQSWESVTEAKFRGWILSYTTISGPCLDHAALLLREQFKNNKANVLKLLSKSWYIGVFQLPFLAPAAWHFFNPERWGKIVNELERKQQLPLNHNIQNDGKHGISLYRANFIPRLSKPRQRYSVCPVQAIVLKHDNFVSPDYISALPQWVDDLSIIEVEANHWAILSQPEKIAHSIAEFAKSHQPA